MIRYISLKNFTQVTAYPNAVVILPPGQLYNAPLGVYWNVYGTLADKILGKAPKMVTRSVLPGMTAGSTTDDAYNALLTLTVPDIFSGAVAVS